MFVPKLRNDGKECVIHSSCDGRAMPVARSPDRFRPALHQGIPMPNLRSFVSVAVMVGVFITSDVIALQEGGAAPQGSPPQGGQRQRDGGGQRQGGRGGFPFNFGGGGWQGRQGGMLRGLNVQNRYVAEFIRRDIPLYKDQLGFDQTQMSVVEALINDYDLAFTPAAEESQEKIREAGARIMQSYMGGDMMQTMRDSRDRLRQDIEQLEVENGGPLSDDARRKFVMERVTKFAEEAMAARRASGADKETKAILQEIFDEITAWEVKRADMRRPVVEGLEAALTPEQREKWPAFQRFLRREKALGSGVLSGESVNLFVVMDEAGLSQSSIDGAAKTLDEYEVALDQALVARDDYLSQSEPKLMKMVLGSNTQGANVVIERQFALRKAVRDVNDQYRVTLLGVLPAEEGAKFNSAAMAAAYPRVFRQTRTAEAFEKALELPDLPPEVRDSLLKLQASYTTELTVLNDRIAGLTHKEEVQQRVDETMRVLAVLEGSASPLTIMGRGMMGMGGGQEQADPVGDLMDQRGDVGTRYLEQLHAMLTPEQQDQLPKGRDGGRNFGNFGSGKISELPEQMQDVAKAADKNKDGTIDDAERTELFNQMRQRRGRGGSVTPGDGQ